MYYVYVLQNDVNNKIYIGQTNNLEARLNRHNGLLSNKSRSYTKINKGSGKWNIVYKESFDTRQKALINEKYLKSHSGRDWLRKYLVP